MAKYVIDGIAWRNYVIDVNLIGEIFYWRNYMIDGIMKLTELHDWQNHAIDEIKFSMLAKINQDVIAKFKCPTKY